MASSSVPRAFTVLVEGNIGCGKTTFLQHFSQFLDKIDVLYEPVDRWRNVNGYNLLGLMYDNPSRWSFPFHSFVQMTMLDNHIFKAPKPVKIMERSVFSSHYCFVENMRQTEKILDCEYEVLNQWFKFVTEEAILPLQVDLIVYLRTSPDKLLERIKSRSRNEELSVNLDYLTQLHLLHETWLHSQTRPVPAPVLTINADSSQADMQASYKKCERLILNMAESAMWPPYNCSTPV